MSEFEINDEWVVLDGPYDGAIIQIANVDYFQEGGNASFIQESLLQKRMRKKVKQVTGYNMIIAKPDFMKDILQYSAFEWSASYATWCLSESGSDCRIELGWSQTIFKKVGANDLSVKGFLLKRRSSTS
jgi:hypothetical protein